MNAHQLGNYKMFVGIDVSKKTLDVGLVGCTGSKAGHKRFLNTIDGMESLLEWIQQHCLLEQCLVCMEHTGLYSRKVRIFLQHAGISLCMESGYVIKRSSGIVKGKTDKLDSYRIAEYALTRRYQLRLMPAYDPDITLLHDLLSTRNRLVINLKRITTPLDELKTHASEESFERCKASCRFAIEGTRESIKYIDNQIDNLIEEHPLWQENVRLGCSVKGIGKQVCLWMLVYTANFRSCFSARQFASLAGIAPFEESSGSSIRKGTHVSHHAHKFLKGLLHAAAMSAINHCPKIKQYHARKKQEGKKGFVVMNNIKNKLVQTVFAVVRSRQPYHEHFIHKRAA